MLPAMQRLTDELRLRRERVPAWAAVTGIFVVEASAVLLLSESAAIVVGVAALAFLALYCVLARPGDGWSVWGAATIPAAIGSIVRSSGGPKWIGLCLIPVAILAAWLIDHDNEVPNVPSGRPTPSEDASKALRN